MSERKLFSFEAAKCLTGERFVTWTIKGKLAV